MKVNPSQTGCEPSSLGTRELKRTVLQIPWLRPPFYVTNKNLLKDFNIPFALHLIPDEFPKFHQSLTHHSKSACLSIPKSLSSSNHSYNPPWRIKQQVSGSPPLSCEPVAVAPSLNLHCLLYLWCGWERSFGISWNLIFPSKRGEEQARFGVFED